MDGHRHALAHVHAILSELSIPASAQFLAEHGASEPSATVKPGARVIDLVYVLSLAPRWPVTFDGTTLTLTTHAEAGAHWATALHDAP